MATMDPCEASGRAGVVTFTKIIPVAGGKRVDWKKQ